MRQEMSEYKPYLVSWNLTRKCNLLCPHCYIESIPADLKPENQELTTKEVRLVIDELSYLNDRLMLILSGGEPMLREDIFDIVEYANQAGFITVMGSNGTLFKKEDLRTLKYAGLKGLGVSLDSTKSECHDRFRGFTGAWRKAVRALSEAREAGIETQMDVTLTEENNREMDNFLELAHSLSVKAINFFFLVCTGRAMKTEITEHNYQAALRKIANFSRTETRLLVKARCAPHIYRILYEDGFPITEGTRGCLAGTNYLRIDPEGNVTPCPYMSMTLGNIREKSLTAIWEDAPYLKQLREKGYKGRCGICEYIEICGGCRARALIEKNDFMAEDPLCTYKPSGTGKVRLNDSLNTDLTWDDRARDRIKKVPVFMQGIVTRLIEAKAKERGLDFITLELIDELKKRVYSGFHGNNKSEK